MCQIFVKYGKYSNCEGSHPIVEIGQISLIEAFVKFFNGYCFVDFKLLDMYLSVFINKLFFYF